MAFRTPFVMFVAVVFAGAVSAAEYPARPRDAQESVQGGGVKPE